MWWTDNATMPWMWFFGPMAMILFLVICLALVFFTMRGGARGGSAIEILKERFARGEIDQAEFEKRRRLIEG